MRRFRFVVGLVAITAAAALSPVRVQAQTPDTSVESVAQHLVGLLAEPGPVSAAMLRERIDAGVPPGAMLVVLDAYRAAPRDDLRDLVKALTTYRGLEVRLRALAAWAALGGSDADGAIAAAAEDIEPRVRRLAVALAAAYPSMRGDEVVAALLNSDRELAAELHAEATPLVPEGPQ